MKNIFAFALPKFTFMVMLTKKPFLLIASTIPAVTLVPVVDMRAAATILFWLFIADLFSGLAAAYFEWRKSSPKEHWFFGKGEGFSSDKFKKCFMKACVYTGTPLIVQKFQQTFLLKNFKYEKFSEAEMTLATVLIIVFCLNEGYSIFHENLPKCGFNLWQRIKKMLGFAREVKKEFSKK